MYNMFLLFMFLQCIFSEEHLVTILTGKLLGQTHKPFWTVLPCCKLTSSCWTVLSCCKLTSCCWTILPCCKLTNPCWTVLLCCKFCWVTLSCNVLKCAIPDRLSLCSFLQWCLRFLENLNSWSQKGHTISNVLGNDIPKLLLKNLTKDS